MISDRQWILLSILTFFALGALFGAVVVQVFTDPGDGRVGRFTISFYVNGVESYSQHVDSPTENWGKLMAKWLEVDNTGGSPHAVSVSLVDTTGTARNNPLRAIYWDGGSNSYEGNNYRYYFLLIDDPDPPAFTRGMYKYSDANSRVFVVADSQSGYYLDANGNLVLYLTSEIYTANETITFEAVALVLKDLNANKEYLLIYDVLTSPLSLNVGDNLQMEYRFIFP